MSTILPPLASTICQSLPTVHYLDAYCQPLPALRSASTVARAIFQRAPGWVMALMRLRDAVVKRLGLRSTKEAALEGARPGAGPLHPGDRLGPFQVFSVLPAEVLLGLNDKHLDFRVAVLVEPAGQSAAIAWVCTAVQFHNVFGRCYFAFIRPFHGLVVRAMLRAGQGRLARETGCTIHVS